MNPTNSNLQGASKQLNDVITKLQTAAKEMIVELESTASEAISVFEETQNELFGLVNKLQTTDIPTLPKLNLPAEIKSLISISPGTSSYFSALAKIKTEFGDDINSAGLELGSLVSSSAKSVLGGGDIFDIIPNLEKVSGVPFSIKPAVKEPIAAKQAELPALTELASVIKQNANILSKVSKIVEKKISYAVSDIPPTEDTGVFKVASEDIAKTLSIGGGKLIKAVLPGSGKNLTAGAVFSHKKYGSNLENYDADIIAADED
jgi:hypothetical protein